MEEKNIFMLKWLGTVYAIDFTEGRWLMVLLRVLGSNRCSIGMSHSFQLSSHQ